VAEPGRLEATTQVLPVRAIVDESGSTMDGMLVELVKRAGRRLGLDISHYRPFSRRRASRVHELGIRTVVDVGANAGQYGRALRAVGYTGAIISLEPLAAAFAELERTASADSSWECLKVAAGAEEVSAQLNVASNTTSSSLLSMTDEHTAGAPTVATVGHEVVTVRPLDELVLPAEPPVMLKLDVQGYEANVLAGAERLLSSTALLECELSLARLYEGQESFAGMVAMLDDYGFALVDLDPFFYDPRDGRVLALDGLFVRRTGVGD
jgi:FkbM family methyltransferase